jgi:hypothetical protein
MPNYSINYKNGYTGNRWRYYTETATRKEAERIAKIARREGTKIRIDLIPTREEFASGKRVPVKKHVQAGHLVRAYTRAPPRKIASDWRHDAARTIKSTRKEDEERRWKKRVSTPKETWLDFTDIGGRP